jgi:hypothetical protein
MRDWYSTAGLYVCVCPAATRLAAARIKTTRAVLLISVLRS